MKKQNNEFLNIHNENVKLLLNHENFTVQNSIHTVGDYHIRKKYLEYLKFYSNNAKKMQKVIQYSEVLNLFMDEYFLISLVEIDNDYIECNMINHFKNNEIKNTHDFIKFYNIYEELYQKSIKVKKMQNL